MKATPTTQYEARRTPAATCPLVGHPVPVVTDAMIDAGMEVFISHASEDMASVLAHAYLAMHVHRPLSEGPQ